MIPEINTTNNGDSVESATSAMTRMSMQHVSPTSPTGSSPLADKKKCRVADHTGSSGDTDSSTTDTKADTSRKDEDEAKDVWFTGVFLSKASRKTLWTLLFTTLPFLDEDEEDLVKQCDHLTVSHGKENAEIIESLGGLGSSVELKVTHVGFVEGKVYAFRACSATDDALVVSENKTPHITIATHGDTRAYESNSITEWEELPEELTVSGKLKTLYKKRPDTPNPNT